MRLQQQQWALQQKQQAASLKKLQEELQAFIKAKQQQQQQQQQSGPSSALVLDHRLQQVQQTQADKKSLEASMEYGSKMNELRSEIDDLKGEIQRRDAASSNSTSSSSFVYGLMELLLILQPNLVINAIASPSFELEPHFTNHPNSTLLFADISGYTALAQSLGAAGAEGTEALSSALDQFFGIAISSIYHFGGDVVKFCGDAILCVFSPDRTIAAAEHFVNPGDIILSPEMHSVVSDKVAVENVADKSDTKNHKLLVSATSETDGSASSTTTSNLRLSADKQPILEVFNEPQVVEALTSFAGSWSRLERSSSSMRSRVSRHDLCTTMFISISSAKLESTDPQEHLNGLNEAFVAFYSPAKLFG
ncbi:hypothetical protein TeGR_g9763, partial [Tetraparma gracilis]